MAQGPDIKRGRLHGLGGWRAPPLYVWALGPLFLAPGPWVDGPWALYFWALGPGPFISGPWALYS